MINNSMGKPQARCSCIICHREYSTKGIFTHFDRIHNKSTKYAGGYHGSYDKTSATARAKRNIKIQEYLKNPSYCTTCDIIIFYRHRRKKFCSKSCSATYNNTHRIRIRKERAPCAWCGEDTPYPDRTYCSRQCSVNGKTKYHTAEERDLATKRLNREHASRYRARLKNQIPDDADLPAIKEFYNNCPPGYEIDHIRPISKGGLHTMSNLQYLTISENRKKSNKWQGG